MPLKEKETWERTEWLQTGLRLKTKTASHWRHALQELNSFFSPVRIQCWFPVLKCPPSRLPLWLTSYTQLVIVLGYRYQDSAFFVGIFYSCFLSSEIPSGITCFRSLPKVLIFNKIFITDWFQALCHSWDCGYPNTERRLLKFIYLTCLINFFVCWRQCNHAFN